MEIVVIADGEQQHAFNDKPIPAGIQVQLVTTVEAAHVDADVYFYLLDEETLAANFSAITNLKNLVVVNAVCTTLDQLPANCVRINAWPGFLQAKSMEIAAGNHNKEMAENIFKKLEWHYTFVPDITGFIVPRTIAMIINEAYFALEEEVSTKAEIDTAMKLGTGYPFGPFEWSEKIGLKKIFDLLTVLSQADARYQPAPLLKKESQ